MTFGCQSISQLVVMTDSVRAGLVFSVIAAGPGIARYHRAGAETAPAGTLTRGHVIASRMTAPLRAAGGVQDFADFSHPDRGLVEAKSVCVSCHP
jgi:hypothetical protein